MALKHYSHYRHSDAAVNMYEVVSPALFEVYFTFPSQITGKVGSEQTELMFQHVRSISGLDGLTPTVGNVVQKFKFAERHYASAGPDKTSLEITITFTLNLNHAHENYIYNMLRRWYNLIYNPQNGQTLTKYQYAKDSRMEIIEHDRNGEIWRRITCFDFFPSTPPTGLNENNYDSVGDAKTLSITFIVDDWVEDTMGAESYRDAADPNTLKYFNEEQAYVGSDVSSSSKGNIYPDGARGI